ncbi:hypothetical protein [uncultured Dokdonia sp.]|uniref:hypothetical protein n=1 Tax=uncultured Dokdonia sp. TaxID=575653 RepID=UPI00261767AA|nr:hypothetical protein [uncultured Dokdonia sp.]
MSKSSTKEMELKQAIVALRKERRETLRDLTQQAYITAEYFKPSNMIGRAFEGFKKESDFKSSLLTTTASYIGGYISKRLLFGKSSSTLKKIFGLGLQIVTTRLIANRMSN